jgi:hypothetical protein
MGEGRDETYPMQLFVDLSQTFSADQCSFIPDEIIGNVANPPETLRTLVHLASHFMSLKDLDSADLWWLVDIVEGEFASVLGSCKGLVVCGMVG